MAIASRAFVASRPQARISVAPSRSRSVRVMAGIPEGASVRVKTSVKASDDQMLLMIRLVPHCKNCQRDNRCAVCAFGFQVYHVPKTAGAETELEGKEGVVKADVSEFKGQETSATLAIRVQFTEPAKFIAHLVITNPRPAIAQYLPEKLPTQLTTTASFTLVGFRGEEDTPAKSVSFCFAHYCSSPFPTFYRTSRSWR